MYKRHISNDITSLDVPLTIEIEEQHTIFRNIMNNAAILEVVLNNRSSHYGQIPLWDRECNRTVAKRNWR